MSDFLSNLRITDQIQRAVPFGRFEFKYVAFTTADTDVAINHTLQPLNSNNVGWLVIQQDRAGTVYQDLSAGRRQWTSDTIYLRSSAANAKACLLIFSPAVSIPTLVSNL